MKHGLYINFLNLIISNNSIIFLNVIWNDEIAFDIIDGCGGICVYTDKFFLAWMMTKQKIFFKFTRCRHISNVSRSRTSPRSLHEIPLEIVFEHHVREISFSSYYCWICFFFNFFNSCGEFKKIVKNEMSVIVSGLSELLELKKYLN